MPTFSHQGELSPVEISKEIEFQAWYDSWLGGVLQDIQVSRDQVLAGKLDNPALERNKAIVKMTVDYGALGTDSVYVGQWRRLTGVPVGGDAQLRGHEESRQIYKRPVYINRLRHATPTTVGKMDDLRGRKFRMGQTAKPALTQWLSDYLSWYICTLALYEGHSFHITRGALADPGGGFDNGLNKGRRHCPNFYVAGAGQVPFSAAHITYDSAIYSALLALDGNGVNPADNEMMSGSLLEKLRGYCIRRKIQPFVMQGGFKFWKYYLHPDAMYQARADDRIMRATESAFRGLKLDDPVLSGGALYYGGFVLCENLMAGSEIHYKSALGNGYRVIYGPMNDSEMLMANFLSSPESSTTAQAAGVTNLKAGLIIGQNCLSVGQNGPAQLEMQIDDYRNFEGVALDIIIGAARNDHYDNIALPTVIENTSMAVVVTNSPLPAA